MKLLLDENISHKIVRTLQAEFPGSKHVKSIEPVLATDYKIWGYAKKNDFIITTFDEDFYEIQMEKGYPPKLLWLRCGNTSTSNLIMKIQLHTESIELFSSNPDLGILEIH